MILEILLVLPIPSQIRLLRDVAESHHHSLDIGVGVNSGIDLCPGSVYVDLEQSTIVIPNLGWCASMGMGSALVAC